MKVPWTTAKSITVFIARRYANRGICRRRVSVHPSVCECVCQTAVLYPNG